MHAGSFGEETVLSVRDVHKRYKGGPEALRGVTFHLRRGETVGIIGRNGAGKSTLLKIIAGVTRPERGRVLLQGRCGGLLELGAAFYPSYTGRENIRLYGTLTGLSGAEIRRITPEIIDFSGLGGRIDDPVRTYSSGMFVRLAFAAAVCTTPDILLIDEALSVGDAVFQKKSYERIRDMADRSTVLMVSHDLHAVTRFCSRILVIEQGSLLFDGDSREAVEIYTRLLQGKGGTEDTGPGGADGPADGQDRQNVGNLPAVLSPPPPECVSGAGRIRITGCALSVDGRQGCDVCREGQRVRILLQVESEEAREDLIVGFQVSDRFGTRVFGNVQIGEEGHADRRLRRLPKGRSLLSCSFRWPRVREGMYFITPGIGTGEDVLRQQEQCWLNDVFRLTAVVDRGTVFGIFNVPMEEYEVRPVRISSVGGEAGEG